MHRMDDVAPIPNMLDVRPSVDCVSRSTAVEANAEGLIAHFEPGSQSARGCAGFQGVRVFPDFLSPSESDELLREIDRSEFVQAQSGKWKQHYGPKINFNKKKMNAKGFHGLPAYAAWLEDRLRQRAKSELAGDPTDRARFAAALESFETTDVFVLQYFEREESNLDFHIDDTFAYGELILDLSLESDSLLTFLRKNPRAGSNAMECVRVPLPARSATVIYGQARFDWEHAILSYDIAERRTSITLRTLHEDLRRSEAGQSVIELARRSRTSH
jgi:alkylated DNA repair protein alkB family protein 4